MVEVEVEIKGTGVGDALDLVRGLNGRLGALSAVDSGAGREIAGRAGGVAGDPRRWPYCAAIGLAVIYWETETAKMRERE